MDRVCVNLIGTLIVCVWAVIAQSEYIKYKDPSQAIEIRIKDLIRKMTLEEKIGQMTQIERTVASAEVMKKYFIGNFLANILQYAFFYDLHDTSMFLWSLQEVC